MTYSDFTLDDVYDRFGLKLEPADLFPNVAPVAVSPWLRETLARGKQMPLMNERARSESVVVPILFEVCELSGNQLSIFSGQRLDVDPAQGLTGECDYILALAPPLPVFRAPLAIILEAKKADIELGLGQCAAQMVAARIFNESKGILAMPLFGCVTTGENWQFLELRESSLCYDRQRYYIDNVEKVLGCFRAMTAACQAARAVA